MDYRVILVEQLSTSEAIRELEGKIKDYISDGWEPVGGVGVSYYTIGRDIHTCLCQGIVKKL